MDCKELDKLPRPASTTIRVVRRPMGPLPTTQAISAPQSHAHALYLRHEQVVPATVLQTLDRLQPVAGWFMVALRQQVDLHLPSLDYSLTNSKLLPQLCPLLLQNIGIRGAQGRQAPPAQQATLTLRLYLDCYQPRGRPNISTNISLIDFGGVWFPLVGYVPRCTDMISWLELPKAVHAQWAPMRAEALHALPLCAFKQRMRYQGFEYTTALKVQFGCITAYHHHHWAECKEKGCVFVHG